MWKSFPPAVTYVTADYPQQIVYNFELSTIFVDNSKVGFFVFFCGKRTCVRTPFGAFDTVRLVRAAISSSRLRVLMPISQLAYIIDWITNFIF